MAEACWRSETHSYIHDLTCLVAQGTTKAAVHHERRLV
jgi:hypothetical protein